MLWSFFHDNPALTKALPALASAVIQSYVAARHGVRVGVIAILHTFNGKLEFNSHVHTMVTAGGLQQSSGTWASSLYYDRSRLMGVWRKAVITLLRAALRAGQFRTELTVDQVEDLLTHLGRCWWSVKIQSIEDKRHFLKYAGRYTRRPPIAEHRITLITDRTVTFWYKDKRLHRRVEVRCSKEEFVERWAQHIPERYQHSVRNFGLFAPRPVSQTTNAIFAVFGQRRRSRPRPLSWSWLMNYTFKRDPLIDKTGHRMKWSARLSSKPVR